MIHPQKDVIPILNPSLKRALLHAKEELTNPNEEEGGFILFKDGVYKFVHISNEYSGTPSASALYRACPDEVGNHVVAELNNGWKMYATYHTHPTNYPAYPSGTDLTRLFLACPVNYIASPSLGQLCRYTYTKENEGWDMYDVELE